MKQLAIKGHTTRGNEVIKLLEMLGGKNENMFLGTQEIFIYTINEEGAINWEWEDHCDKYIVYSLEEFLEKFPYKVGDIVSSKYLKNYKIEKMEWEYTNNRVIYKLQGMGWYSVDELQPYKEETMEASEEFFNKYCVNCGSQRCTAEGEGLEECKHYKEETMGEKKINQMSLANCDLDEVEIVLGDKFELVNREGKYYAVRKKPKYPKTYEDCCVILNLPHSELTIDVPLHYSPTLIYLTKLLICRDAYWKIAGEQMGLGKPWEPDWDNEDKRKYAITCQGNHIAKDLYYIKNTILAFPTEEMPDEFFENFKDLIERCKELL